MKQLFLCTTQQTMQEGNLWKREIHEEVQPFPRLLSEGSLLSTTQGGRVNAEHITLSGLRKHISKFIATLAGFVGQSPEEKRAEQSRWQIFSWRFIMVPQMKAKLHMHKAESVRPSSF